MKVLFSHGRDRLTTLVAIEAESKTCLIGEIVVTVDAALLSVIDVCKAEWEHGLRVSIKAA